MSAAGPSQGQGDRWAAPRSPAPWGEARTASFGGNITAPSFRRGSAMFAKRASLGEEVR